MKFIALIPARGGSKGVPEKNIKIIKGKPLIAYTIEQALKSGIFSEVFVNTDSAEIAEIALKTGAKVPFLRPSDLATDNSGTLDVVKHSIPLYEKISDFDAVFLLQPTSPFRRMKDFIETKKLLENGSLCVVSYSEPNEHPSRMRFIDEKGVREVVSEPNSLRRQELSPVFVRNGAIYAFMKSLPFEENSLVTKNHKPVFMDSFATINIDSPFDMMLAELIFEKFYDDRFFEGECVGDF